MIFALLLSVSLLLVESLPDYPLPLASKEGLEKPQVAYRDELLEWDGIDERALMKRLSNMFTVRFNFMPLTDDQIHTIRGIIHPEVGFRTEPATLKSVPEGLHLKPNATIIKALDYKQEQLA